MSILQNNPVGFFSAGTPTSQYQIQRSLRFNNPTDTADLTRTPVSAGNRKTWTWSGWVKRGTLAGRRGMFGAVSGAGYHSVEILGDQIHLFWYNGTAFNAYVLTNAVFRDTSAWMHVVAVFDTTQTVAADRTKIYVNGVLQTLTLTNSPAQNSDGLVNTTVVHSVGNNAAGDYYSGYLADIHFIDGQALTPSSFGQTDATTGEWVPIQYSGTYGTNGFHLDFADNSAATAAALGKDTSGNGNNWTPNNLSVTAGAGNDSLVDTPTSYGTDTGVGGEVRGNYCTWNPVGVSNYGTTAWPVVNGALDANDNTSNIYGVVPGTMAVSSGKWYWEITVTTGLTAITFYAGLGIELASITAQRHKGLYGSCYYYNGDGTKNVGTTSSAYGTAWTSGDVIGVALDFGAGTVTFYRNNTSQGAISITAGEYRPVVGDYDNGAGTNFTANFGQRPFAYTAPSGFKALCDTNLPAPTIVKPSTVMDVKLYTGNGSTQTISGLGFSPDLVWIKERNNAASHCIFDSVRGTSKVLGSNNTNAEDTTNALGAFNADGFSLLTPNTGGYAVGDLNDTYVAWCWDAGSSTVTNTSGTISSQVRANASAGFSIVTYTGNSSASASIGHGLGVAPGMIIVKNRDSNVGWAVYHSAVGTGKYLFLNGTNSAYTATNSFTAVSASTFTVETDSWVTPNNTANYVAYCFAPVAGYSAFGSYTGNGNADGPFVYTGFRPRWVMIKSSSALQDWVIKDTGRSAYNVAIETLAPNSSNAETTVAGNEFDVLSSGFKLRSTGGNYNTNAGTYIYAAFAEFPFQTSRAR